MTKNLSYKDRAPLCVAPIGKRLFELLDSKKTNLAVSADVTSSDELLHLADLVGPEICVLKTHIDIIDDFTPSLSVELKKLADKHQFLLFEDRKFADIGHTVKHQYSGGVYRIADWADIINAHSLPGPGIVQGLAEAGVQQKRGLLLLAEMSSYGHLMSDEYKKQTLRMAEQFAEFVIGFITQKSVSTDQRWINMTPGIKLQDGYDSLGQQYITPEKAIIDHLTDIIIVGRGIYGAQDPLEEAKKFRSRGWQAYLNRL